jgi:hypothetical protein
MIRILIIYLLPPAEAAHDLKRKRLYELQNAKALTDYRSLGLSPTQIRLIFQDLAALSDVAEVVPEQYRAKLKELAEKVSGQKKSFLLLLQLY